MTSINFNLCGVESPTEKLLLPPAFFIQLSDRLNVTLEDGIPAITKL
ncbi:hypothetical protein LC609_24270 [Nostoc sp. XA013]|nr:hypothetical protein [Nostoc sp. XA013]